MLTYSDKQVIMMLYATRKPFSLARTNAPGFYPAYLSFQYGIRDPFDFHMDLMSEGYYEEASVTDILNSLTLSRLKSLADGKCKKSGTKKELIERILTVFSEDELRKMLPDDYFVLSEEAEGMLSKNSDFILLHQNQTWMISYNEYMIEKDSCPPDFSFRDVVWRIINKRISYANPYSDYDVICDAYRALADVTLKLDHSEGTAVSLTMTTVLFEMCRGVNDLLRCQVFGYPLSDANDIPFCFPPHGIKFLQDNSDIVSHLRFDKTIKPMVYKRVFTEDDFVLLKNDLSQEAFDSKKWIQICEQKTDVFRKTISLV